jgi:hypothetical protein
MTAEARTLAAVMRANTSPREGFRRCERLESVGVGVDPEAAEEEATDGPATGAPEKEGSRGRLRGVGGCGEDMDNTLTLLSLRKWRLAVGVLKGEPSVRPVGRPRPSSAPDMPSGVAGRGRTKTRNEEKEKGRTRTTTTN